MYPFVSIAYAQSAGDAGSQSPFFQFIPLVLILGVFWFLIIRPQQKKQKEHMRMVESLKKGDKVVSNGGIFGTIVKVGDEVTVRVREIDNRGRINLTLRGIPQNGDTQYYPQPTPTHVAPLM